MRRSMFVSLSLSAFCHPAPRTFLAQGTITYNYRPIWTFSAAVSSVVLSFILAMFSENSGFFRFSKRAARAVRCFSRVRRSTTMTRLLVLIIRSPVANFANSQVTLNCFLARYFQYMIGLDSAEEAFAACFSLISFKTKLPR